MGKIESAENEIPTDATRAAQILWQAQQRSDALEINPVGLGSDEEPSIFDGEVSN